MDGGRQVARKPPSSYLSDDVMLMMMLLLLILYFYLLSLFDSMRSDQTADPTRLIVVRLVWSGRRSRSGGIIGTIMFN